MNHAQYSDIRRGLARGMYPMFSQVKSDRMQHTAREIVAILLVPASARIRPALLRFAELPKGSG